MIFWLHCAQLIEILSARVSIYEKFILKYCQIVFSRPFGKKHGYKNMNTLIYIEMTSKEIEIIHRFILFLVNCYLLHVPRLPSQPASNVGG